MEDVEDIYELAPMQHGMLFDSVTVEDSGMYAIQLEYFLRGPLSAPEFEEAWSQTVARHPILRTSLHWEDLEKPLQVVRRSAQISLPYEDWSGLSPEEQDLRSEAFRRDDRRSGFDFEEAPLMRLALFRVGDDRHRLLWTFHHILMEGWSASQILGEVLARYRSATTGSELELAEHRPYRDYVAWIQEQDPLRAEAYWKDVLAGFETPTHLPVDLAPTSTHTPVTEYDGRKIELSEEETASLQAFARKNDLTLNTVVQGAWAVLLSSYTGQEDVVFGTIVSGRSVPLEGVETILGLFVNMLPTRVRVGAGEPVLEWLRALQRQQVRQRDFEHCPLVAIKGWSEVPAGFPLFESLLVFENWHGDLSERDWGAGLEVSDVHGHHGAPGYPMTAVVIPDRRLTFGISYDTKRFTADVIDRILANSRTLLAAIVADPLASIARLPLLSPVERERAVREWNATEAGEVPPELVHRRFARRAEETPDAVALVAEGESLTYGELAGRARGVARLLSEQGIAPRTLVGLCVERDPWMIAGMLGILEAGCAFVPMDPAQPEERLRLLIEDSKVTALLAQERLVDRVPGVAGVRTIALDPVEPVSEAGAGRVEVGAQDAAYVIYTSGSTGRPKGVVVPHGALANYADHAARSFGLTPADRVLQFASISFDTAAEEIFPTFLAGAGLVLRTDAMLSSVEDFLDACREQGITVLDLPTAYWHVIVGDLEGTTFPTSIRLVILGGEAAKPEQLATWFREVGEGPRLLNTYGPTEATIVATESELTAADAEHAAVAIGRPVRSVQAYVLDARGEPVPVGVPGELHLGGAGLARGYLDRPALTAERFVPDPFSGRSGARLYRTGDLVRQREDGSLEFAGRRDGQVKFRGYRIELGEIEAALALHTGVEEAVVLLREDRPSAQRLVAYVVANDPAPSADALRTHLSERLPEYMVPSATVFLDELPMTSSRKVDRAALPEPDRTEPVGGTGFVEPRNPLEEQIAEIWQEVLGVDRIGVYDSFFDLGGHSLLLMQVTGHLKKKLGVRLTPGELVVPTLGQLAALCQERLNEPEPDAQSGGLMKRLVNAIKGFSPAPPESRT